MQQFYLAYQDAKRTIELRPDWAKGYFRKAEVEFATFQFDKALTSYTKAFCLQKDDRSLMDAMKKAARELKKDQRADKQIPWLGAGIGIIVGVAIVLADYLVADKPVLLVILSFWYFSVLLLHLMTFFHSVQHPILKVLLTIAISLLGFGFCKAYRYYIKTQRESLILPPIDLIGGKYKNLLPSVLNFCNINFVLKSDDHSQENSQEATDDAALKSEMKDPQKRFSKAQARHRYKKGKAN